MADVGATTKHETTTEAEKKMPDQFYGFASNSLPAISPMMQEVPDTDRRIREESRQTLEMIK